MTEVSLNLKRVTVAAEQAFKESCFLLGREFSQLISESGAFPNYPDRDLVDTGRLRASQRVDFPRRGKAIFSWSTEYALYQHEGYTLRNGQNWPGRPWTREGLSRFNLQQTYRTLLEAKLNP